MRSAPWDAYEVLRLTGESAGVVSARVELIKSGHPELRVETPERVERFLHHESMATVEKVVLGNWTGEDEAGFELVLSGSEDFLEFYLHGHRKFHLYGWRLEFELHENKVLTRGPHLASEPGS